MLIKTIKTILTISVVTLFLAACSTTSTESGEGTSGTSTSSSSSTSSTGGSTGGNVNNLPPTVLATVFYFDFDSANLREGSRRALDQHAANLKANPRAIRLEGHADERGTRQYNEALGERRAQAVQAYLQSKGVNSPIEVVSYGEEKPAVETSNEYAWSQNRRVELK